ncbi:MAG: hypothetical protein Solivirus5_15 [Solivirus sp.]|uniref:Uncharacterized protein n=1 Tax=Solivirus sp. TaxID=2487772 RepID=A0A3G5AFZ4_9VIRU|nr:MAG: hypothetical protein Solivirus5_15 [Solivirus sp.]
MSSVIYFRGLDLGAIVSKFITGGYSGVTRSCFTKREIVASESKALITTQEIEQRKSYISVFADGRTYIRLGYIVYDKDGVYKPIDPNQIFNCMFCLRRILPNDKFQGLPIYKTVEGDKVAYHEIDIFCTWDCACAEYNCRSKNTLYEYTYTYMKELFHLTTGRPENELKPASDKRCLQIFNGPQSWEEFHKSTMRFAEKTPLVYFFPVLYYIEQDKIETFH